MILFPWHEFYKQRYSISRTMVWQSGQYPQSMREYNLIDGQITLIVCYINDPTKRSNTTWL